jgi:hypothetical protein
MNKAEKGDLIHTCGQVVIFLQFLVCLYLGCGFHEWTWVSTAVGVGLMLVGYYIGTLDEKKT